MRILFALPGLHRYNRGAEIAFISIARELAKAGDVTDLWSGRSYGRQSALDVPLKPHEGTVLVVR